MSSRIYSLAISDRVYRSLLVLYPTAFRDEYADSLLQVFRDCCRAAHRDGGTLGVMRLWLPMLGDLVSTAFAERVSEVLRMPASSPLRNGVLVFVSMIVGGIWGIWNHFLDDLLYAIPEVGPFLASDARLTALVVFAFWLILALALIWLNTRLQGTTWTVGVTCAMLWGSGFFFFLLYDLYQDWPRIVAVGGSVQTVGGFVPTWVAHLAAWLAYSALFSLGGFAVGWAVTFLRNRFMPTAG